MDKSSDEKFKDAHEGMNGQRHIGEVRPLPEKEQTRKEIERRNAKLFALIEANRRKSPPIL